MSKSPQYNQKTESKNCEPEVEQICIYQNLESGCHSIGISENKYLVGSMLEKVLWNNV